MRVSRLNKIVILLVFVLACPVLLLQATVFRGSRMAGDLFAPDSFGAEIYKAVMQINGGVADVSVAVCEGGVAAVRSAIVATGHGDGSGFSPDMSLGMGSAKVGDRSVKVVTLVPDANFPVMMVSVLQRQTEVSASRPALARHQLADVPIPADANVLSYLKNQDTRTALERVSSRMPRETLARYYEQSMAQQGWSRSFRVAARPGLSIYLKGADLCWVRIGDTDSNGETRVILLHKAGAVN